MAMEDAQEFSFLIGMEVSCVAFVRDYLEVGFDGPILRLLGIMDTKCEGVVLRDGDAGFEASIRNLVGETIVNISATIDVFIVFFSNNCTLTNRRDSGEYVHLMREPDTGMAVW